MGTNTKKLNKMEPNKILEEPKFSFTEQDWPIIKEGLSKLPFEVSAPLLHRMMKQEFDMAQYQKSKEENGTKGE